MLSFFYFQTLFEIKTPALYAMLDCLLLILRVWKKKPNRNNNLLIYLLEYYYAELNTNILRVPLFFYSVWRKVIKGVEVDQTVSNLYLKQSLTGTRTGW